MILSRKVLLHIFSFLTALWSQLEVSQMSIIICLQIQFVFVWKAWTGTRRWQIGLILTKITFRHWQIYFDYLIHSIILIKNILQFNLFMKSQAGHWQIDLVKCISSKLKANWSWKCILLSNYESWDQAMTNWSCQMYCMEMEIFSNIMDFAKTIFSVISLEICILLF